MRRLGCAFIFAGAFFGATAFAEDPAWSVPGASFRAVVAVETPSKNPEAGYAITLPEFGQTQADMSDVLLTDESGHALPLATVYRREGQSALLLAQTLDAQKKYFVYFGGTNIRRGPAWSPKISLLMETRRAPAGAVFDDWPSLEKAWRGAESDGAKFVSLVYHGENLFGDSRNFLTHYSGYLQTSGSDSLSLYTLSSDASFVLVNGRYEFGWPGKHPPRADENSAPSKAVPCSAGFTQIDYYAAKGDSGHPPAMVLGWKHDGKFETIPAEAWLHPGKTKVMRIEEAHGDPVPVVEVKFNSYLGYNGLWFFETNLSLPAQKLDGWSVQWTFSDGAIVSGNECTRALPADAAQTVTVVLQRDEQKIRGVRRISFFGDPRHALVKNADDLARYLDLFDKENPAQLSAATLRAGFKFLREFGTDRQLGRFADALLGQKLDPNDPLWLDAELAHLRLLAQNDPQRALSELRRIDSAIWKKNERPLDLFELDLLAFQLHDPSIAGRASQIAFQNPNSDLARLAKVRVGDLQRVFGNYPQAIAQYQSIGLKTGDRSLPAQDRACSIAVNDLLDNGYRDEAAGKLAEWEGKHPMAKFDSDFLLLRARVLMRFGRWNEALAELESFEKAQPESSFEIDAEFYRARALYELERKDEARKIWNGIAKNFPKHEFAEQSKQWAAKP